MLESSVQQASKEGLEVEGLVRMDVLPVVGTLEEVATGMLGHNDGVCEEEIPECFIPKRDPT